MNEIVAFVGQVALLSFEIVGIIIAISVAIWFIALFIDCISGK